jgi:dTDP-glucose 4,6-dehydratase
VKSVLVTGGAGFIGSNFVRYLLKVDTQIHVINFDALTYAGCLENLQDLPDESRHTFIEGDICDRDLVEVILREYIVDTIVHFAAETHVDRSIVSPSPFMHTNILGTFTLLEAARQYWLREEHIPIDRVRFHQISTDEVYGTLELDEPAFLESSPYQPNSPYAASKASSDHLVRAYGHTYDLPILITNCSNNYGPCQFPEKIIPLVILNATKGEPLPIYGDGGQIRDWLYVEDHCGAIWRVLNEGQVGETYNIGGNNQTTNLALVLELCGILDEKLSGSPCFPHENLITFVEDRPGHDYRYALDTTKIKADLGWQPKESLASGLRKTVDWYLSNEAWIQAIRSRSSYQSWIEENYAARGEVS